MNGTTAPAAHTARHDTLRMVGGGLLLGTIGVFLEQAGQHPLTAVLFRCLFGAAAIGVFAWATGRAGELWPSRAGLKVASFTGALMVLMWGSFFAAIQWTSIALATVVFHLQPVWVMLAAALWLGDRLTPARALGVVLALAGLVLATGLWPTHDDAQGAAHGERFMAGVAMAALGSLCYAAVTLIARQQRAIGSLALTFWQCAAGVLLLLWWPAVHELPARAAAWPLATWAWLAGLGVLHTALAYALMYGAMQGLRAGQIAVLQFVYPATAIVIDVLVYQRTLSLAQTCGVVLMAAALLWSGRSTPGSTPPVVTPRLRGGRPRSART